MRQPRVEVAYQTPDQQTVGRRQDDIVANAYCGYVDYGYVNPFSMRVRPSPAWKAIRDQVFDLARNASVGSRDRYNAIQICRYIDGA